MALMDVTSDQITNSNASPKVLNPPADITGKVRIQYFSYTQGAVVADIASTFDLLQLPPGRIRILSKLSNVSWSALGAARTMSIGLRAYTLMSGVAEPVQAALLDSAKDWSAAGVAAIGTALLKDQSIGLTSQAGITVFATIAGGTVPVGATISGWLAYTRD